MSNMRSYHVEFDIEVDADSGWTHGVWRPAADGYKEINASSDTTYVVVPGNAKITETTPKDVADGNYVSVETHPASPVVYRRRGGDWKRLDGTEWNPTYASPRAMDCDARAGQYTYLGPLA